MKNAKWVVLIALTLVGFALAQIPSQMSYQGRITDSAGNPITNPIFPMEFRICEDSFGTITLWQTDGLVLVDVNEGYFTHPLGSSTPLPESLSNYSALWLGITAGGDSEMPLVKIISTGYSYKSLEASHAQDSENAVHADIASYSAEAEHANNADAALYSEESNHAATADYAADSDLLDGLNADAFTDTSHSHMPPDTVDFAINADTANVARSYIDVSLPIGAVTAWFKDFPNIPSLPENYVECNGQVLDDPASAFHGETIPNLNGEGRFLRGSMTSGGVGGSATSTHSHGIPTQCAARDVGSYCPAGTYTTDETISILPPYYNVVWIMRVK